MEEKKRRFYANYGYGLIRTIIQEQNLILLNKIADTMSLSELKREELIEEFHKVNYYSPQVIISKKENIQNLFVKIPQNNIDL